MTENNSNTQAAAQAQNTQPQFSLQRVFLKDVSCELPNAPKVFLEAWKPNVRVGVNTRFEKLDDNNNYNVDVLLKVTCALGEEGNLTEELICEVEQSGIFSIVNVEGTALAHALQVTCPSILFPYAAEVVSNLITKASLPAPNLLPINFEQIFQQKLQEQAGNAAVDGGNVASNAK